MADRISLIIDNPSDEEQGLFSALLPDYGGDTKGARANLVRDALRALYTEKRRKQPLPSSK